MESVTVNGKKLIESKNDQFRVNRKDICNIIQQASESTGNGRTEDTKRYVDNARNLVHKSLGLVYHVSKDGSVEIINESIDSARWHTLSDVNNQLCNIYCDLFKAHSSFTIAEKLSSLFHIIDQMI